MSLPSNYLDAFQAVARAGGFSQATHLLHVSQSALSQRVKNLEEELGLTLFVRNPHGVQLTDQGEKLLRYCQTRDSLEEELFLDMSIGPEETLSGNIRIGCYSSVFRSVILPALSILLSENEGVQCEFVCADMKEQPGLLQRSEVDFIVMDYKMESASIETQTLGTENFAVIEARKPQLSKMVFLDNDPLDNATESFFRAQKKPPQKYHRSFLHDCYGIIDGVKNGLGRAVMPTHLVKNDRSIKIDTSYKPYKREVVLHYYQQPFYSRLHQKVIEALSTEAPKLLKT